VEGSNDFRPEALIAYPSVAAALAGKQLQGRLRIAPGLVAVVEVVDEHGRPVPPGAPPAMGAPPAIRCSRPAPSP
jgi:hypothetical protein